MRYDGRRFEAMTRTRDGLEIDNMAANRDTRYLRGLLRELRSSHEAEWVEFKVNNENPALIGEYISALANAAALAGKAHGYAAWGIEDETHALAGTNFSPRTARKGNEALETWLSRLLEPQVAFRFHELPMDDKRFVLLEVDGAAHRPVAFQGTEFIRVGVARTRGDEGICRRLRRVDGLHPCSAADARGERTCISAIRAGVSAAGGA